MKKILLLVMILLSLPLAAQSYSVVAHKDSFFKNTPPAEFLEAVHFMQEYDSAKNGPLSPEQAKYEQMASGIVVLNFSFFACHPCYDMWSFLGEEGIFELWKEKGVRYYQVDVANRKLSAPYVKEFNVHSSPTLVFLIDGKEYARRRGGVDFRKSGEDKKFLKQIKTLTKLD